MKAIGAMLLALTAGAQLSSATRYVVKFNTDSTLRQVSYKLNEAKKHSRRGSTFLSMPMAPESVNVLGVNARDTKTLETLSMMEIELEGVNQAKQLEMHPDVAYIEEEVIFDAPKFAPLNNQQQEITWGLQAVDAVSAWNQGATGAGVRVLVLDTGIDKDHPDLRDNFVEGQSFIHGMPTSIEFSGGGNLLDNFLFDAFNQEEELSPYDYFDDVGHGTHVSGTIAAGYNGFGVAGVAPQAQLLAGKVCSRLGCSSLAILNGMNWAIESQSAVVNMSLGGAVPSRSQMEAAQRVDDAGILIVAASGNDAEFEKNKIAFPAGYPSVFSVGAITPEFQRAPFSQYGPELDIVAPGTEVDSSVPTGTGRDSKVEITFQGETQRVNSSSFTGSEDNAIPVNAGLAYAGLGMEIDFAEEDLFIGRIALIQRGQITFADKVTNALAAGAVGVIIYNNTTGLISGSITTDGSSVGIPVAMIEQHVGEAIVNTLGQSENIFAAVSVERTDYAGFAGTSMASPHVAGVAALLKSINPALTPSQMRDVLRSTATSVDASTLDNEYGAGVVNAGLAVQSLVTNNLVTQN